MHVSINYYKNDGVCDIMCGAVYTNIRYHLVKLDGLNRKIKS